MIGARHLQIARTSRRGYIVPPPVGLGEASPNGGLDLGCQTSARLDRLAVLRSGAEGSGALGRHQRRSIVSGTILKPNAMCTPSGASTELYTKEET